MTHFLFGIHCHQPVDNFHEVVNEAILKSYRPFLEIASRYESFRFSVHFSGWLFEFIREHDGALFTLMQQMASRGQIEFFSGGFYEPILSSIPSKDRIDQVKKLNTYLQTHFNQTPRGLWLTERVWDSGLIGDMKGCGIEYMVVDDYHFISTGFEERHLHGYYLTENGGETMALFPINKELRYLIPFKSIESVSAYLEDLAGEEDRAAVLFDDGEKFGVWPKTYEWVYESGWLERFMGELERMEKVYVGTYREYFDTHKPLGLAYLPPYSYYEMGEWSLNAKDAVSMERMRESLSGYPHEELNKFLKGSIWKNFLVKYYESNHIHKRTLELSGVRTQVNNSGFDEWLFKAQTNDVLWHGIFGGLYLPNLRDNAYRFILEAENLRYGGLKPSIEVNDFNMDGYSDLKYVGKNFIALFDSRMGGQLNELGLRESCFNLQNTLRRYKESYHEKIADHSEHPPSQEGGGIDTIHTTSIKNRDALKAMLVFDWYAKNSFIDHITDDDFDAHRFERCSFAEYGDFVNHPFLLADHSESSASFVREGGIYIDGSKYRSTLNKHYTFFDEGIGFNIVLDSLYPGALTYVLELNFHFAQLNDVTINGRYLEEEPMHIVGEALILDDPYTERVIRITMAGVYPMILARNDTLSQSEIGFERTNQGVSIAIVVSYHQQINITGSVIIERRNSCVTF